jgi:hypothetical protein
MNRKTLLTNLVVFLTLSVFIAACRRDNDPIPALSCNDINENTVWSDRGDGVDYILNCVITVNAKLTIEPGVIIQFRSNAGIVIESAGSLVAAGTSVKPIQLKGDEDIAGVWKGLYIKSNNVLNELNYCTISNGGSESFDGNTARLANIRVASSAKLKLQNSVVSKSAKDGLYVDGFDTDEANPVTAFSNNQFTGNMNYPVSTIGGTANVLDGESSIYTGNVNNKILLRGGRLFGTHVWKKMAIPYLIESVVSAGYYNNEGNLTIEPGVIVEFAGDAGLCTGDYATGSWLSIVGDALNRITLTGETASPGAWKGLAFQSTSPNNVISYTDISYGGSSSYTGNTNQRGNVRAGAWSAGSFTIDNSTITNSEAWGIYVTLSSPAITVPGSVTYSGNTSGNYYHE